MSHLRWALGLPFIVIIIAVAIPLYVLGRFVVFVAETLFAVRGNRDLTPAEAEGIAMVKDVIDVLNGRCAKCRRREIGELRSEK